jgi:uncharacterized protein HemY
MRPSRRSKTTIKKEPNRLNALLGAGRAAERLGDKAKAKAYYQKVASLAKDADPIRPELAAARKYAVED